MQELEHCFISLSDDTYFTVRENKELESSVCFYGLPNFFPGMWKQIKSDFQITITLFKWFCEHL